MKDPYSVLGIPPSASDEEVKRAYRALARKYHPDNYQDNPLADLAEEKMKAINAAYDAICKEREEGRSGGYGAGSYTSSQAGSGYGSGSYASGQSGGADPTLAHVRVLIGAGALDEAERILNGVTQPGAEWYFLRGRIAYRRGWLDEAARNYEIACRMDPVNLEYRQALSSLHRSGQSSQPFPTGGSSCGCGDCCTTLICLDCMTPGCGCC